MTGAATLAVVALAGPAVAHVTVNPRTAEQGSFTKVSFRVPNERDGAGTTKLRIDLPAEQPVAFVSVRPVPGWKVEVDKAKLAKPVKIDGGELTEAVSRITWSGGRIDPAQFEEFDVSMGPLPTGTDRMVFKAEQTYSNGEVVRWDQDPGDGGNEPEHPAPVLALTPKAAGSDHHAGPAAQVKDDGDASDGDGTARLLGGAGLGVGVLGVVIGGLGLVRGRGRS
ncbi:YcnI family copper-binding membrane protein [Thermomonospora echinospora]|uniref:YcnI family copper-binding membrane protein n=1 Tax=Thermomonospora echinospora TaxID=1992 RepID=UPI001F1CF00D|nr:YcnI family protein [Thermomonospora echinospora]